MSMTGIRTAVAAAVLTGAAAAGGGCASAADVVRGTALYRERIALPPGALLEVTLEDAGAAPGVGEEMESDS